jgi:hypothetical protein
MTFGSNIDKGIKDSEEPESREQELDPEIEALIEDVYQKVMAVPLREIKWRGKIVEEPEVYEWAIKVFKDLEAQKYPVFQLMIDGESHSRTKLFMMVPHILQYAIDYTKRWNAMTDEEQEEELAFSELQEKHQQWFQSELTENGDRICGNTRERNLEWFIYKDPATGKTTNGRPFNWDDPDSA